VRLIRQEIACGLSLRVAVARQKILRATSTHQHLNTSTLQHPNTSTLQIGVTFLFPFLPFEKKFFTFVSP
jgi:hypothetical protein